MNSSVRHLWGIKIAVAHYDHCPVGLGEICTVKAAAFSDQEYMCPMDRYTSTLQGVLMNSP